MKKNLITFICVFLTGCSVFSPKYYDDEQAVTLQYPKGVNLTMENYTLHASEVKTDTSWIRAKRSFNSLNFSLSKEGFETKKIEVKSHLSDDKWAEKVDTSPWMLPKYQSVSGLFLFFPCSTINGTIELPIVGTISGLGMDIYNLFYGIPSVIIKNPWYEYDKEIDLSKEILIPTFEFKHQCHTRSDMFIGNNDCVPCLANEIIISTQEECFRCLNRSWNNNECSLKKTKLSSS